MNALRGRLSDLVEAASDLDAALEAQAHGLNPVLATGLLAELDRILQALQRLTARVPRQTQQTQHGRRGYNS